MHTRTIIRVFASAVVIAGSGAPGRSAAAAISSSPASSDREQRNLEQRIGELLRSGQDRFETSDFERAIEVWTEAYEQLPDGPEFAPTRAMLLANIAQAHVRAHEVGGGVDHLRKADGLYAEYLTMVDPTDGETRRTIESERDRIAHLLDEHELAQAEAEAERPPPTPAEPDPARPEAPSQPPRSSADAPRPGFARYTRWERAVVIGGGVALALGVGLTGAMGTFVWLRDEAEKEGSALARDPAARAGRLRDLGRSARRFNGLAVSTGAAAGVLAAIGLGLIGAGHAHRNRRLRRGETALAPVVSRRGGGIAIVGEF